MGAVNSSATDFISLLAFGRRLSIVSDDLKQYFLFQRLSPAVQRFNAAIYSKAALMLIPVATSSQAMHSTMF
jgi:hypothetical protein